METSNKNLINLQQYKEKYYPQIEIALRENLPVSPPKIETQFNLALETVLFSGEERLRSILTMLGSELFGTRAEDVLPASVAVEYVFTSSQIFQALKCFSNGNEDLKTENIDERLMILVALGCLNSAYPLVFVNHIGMPDRAMQAHREIVECVGASGLIGELANAQKPAEVELSAHLEQVLVTYDTENSALIRLALRLGAILAGADYLDLANLSRVAEIIGEAYQISNALGRDVDLSFKDAEIIIRLNNLVDEAKRLLIENFPSNEARSCLIQLLESLSVD